jgi:hypothetical protein
LNNFYTYIWRDPKDHTIRYVGKGTGRRVWQHLLSPKYQVGAMLNKRHSAGYVCLPQIIWANSEAEALELEVFLISEIGRLDLGTGSLFNLTDGGDGTSGHKWSPESHARRAKAISIGKKGKPNGPMSASHRAAIGRSVKGKTVGRKLSAERRQQISDQQRGRKPSPELVAKRAEGIRIWWQKRQSHA